MRAMIIDEASKSEIKRVKEYAESHIISREQLHMTMELMASPVGDEPGFKCIIPNGYCVVYSIEDQPAGLCHHLSISVDDPEKLPSVPAVENLMAELGLSPDINNCLSLWIEKDIATASGKKGVAINILQYRS